MAALLSGGGGVGGALWGAGVGKGPNSPSVTKTFIWAGGDPSGTLSDSSTAATRISRYKIFRGDFSRPIWSRSGSRHKRVIRFPMLIFQGLYIKVRDRYNKKGLKTIFNKNFGSKKFLTSLDMGGGDKRPPPHFQNSSKNYFTSIASD